MSDFFTITDPSDYESFDPNGPSPNVVNRFHANDDCDSSFYAHHHTIGTKPNQAAAGNHLHDDKYVPLGGNAVEWDPNIRNLNDTALAHSLLLCRFKVVDGICHWKIVVNILANGAFVKFNLPVLTDFVGFEEIVGTGRENAATGQTLQVIRQSGAFLNAIVYTYNNLNTAVNGWQLVLGGSYIVDNQP